MRAAGRDVWLKIRASEPIICTLSRSCNAWLELVPTLDARVGSGCIGVLGEIAPGLQGLFSFLKRRFTKCPSG